MTSDNHKKTSKKPLEDNNKSDVPLADDDANNLIKFLRMVPDPRHARGVRYRYDDLLLMCIYSILAGYENAVDIPEYVRLHYDYFKQKIGLEAIPSHDTFSRIMRLTDFEALSKSLDEWLRAAFPQIYTLYNDKKVMHIDGKATRGAYKKSEGCNPIYYLNSMVEGESIGVTVKRVEEKTNEITCLPEYLGRFNLNDTIVTIDGIGCNARVIDAIQQGGGNYVVPLKENQPNLYNCVKDRVNELEQSGQWKNLPKVSTVTKNHGRTESITFTMIENTAFIYEALGDDSFYGSIGKIGVQDKKVTKMQGGKEVVTKARSYFITDIEEIKVETLLKIQKSHWNIEMQHWILDMQLNEDGTTARRDNAGTNGVILRRFCMTVKSLAKFEGTYKAFQMANASDIYIIEDLLFNKIQPQQSGT